MSDWSDLKEMFDLDDAQSDELLDIVNWITSLWVQERFGYPKDSPQNVSIEKRFLDSRFRTLFDEALIEMEWEVEKK